MLRPGAVWLWDNSASAYVDLSSSISTNSSITFLEDANDVIYIGTDRRGQGLYIDIGTAGSYSSLVYSYITNGDTWKVLSLVDSYSFNTSKYLRWIVPDNWIKFNAREDNPHSATPPDTIERYWIRITASTVTTAAVISKLRVIPFVEYCTPTDVARFLQFKKDFDNSTNPTDLVVEKRIRAAEDRIDYITFKSFRFNAVPEEFLQYSRYGIYPRHKDLMKVYGLSIWDGSGWDTLSEGRTSDYWVDYNRGLIYITRQFTLPATYGMVGRYFAWSYGEYAYSIKLDYAYGRDSETHPEFHNVEELAIKIAAIDILRHHDYSNFVVSNVDAVRLESKISILENEISNELEEMKGVFLV